MELAKISNSDLISSFKRLVKTERKITHLVLLHIIEVENRKLHLQLGYDRMFSYLTKEMGYSEYAAYERIRAAQLLKKIPGISEKIESGTLNLTQITEVQKCLREKEIKGEEVSTEKTLEVLDAIENKNGFNTQKYLAQEFNLPIKQHESTKPQQDESVRLEMTFTKEEFAELQMAKELLSHVCPQGKWSDVITTLAKKLNQNKLGKFPVRKATDKSALAAETESKPKEASASSIINSDNNSTQSFLVSSGDSESLCVSTKDCTKIGSPSETPASVENKIGKYRPYISIKVKRQLLRKANFQCEYVHSQRGRCSSNYHLQVDHVRPLALHGDHDISNLRILCGAHNRNQAFRSGLRRPG
jgi:5-methylcytosine-specific restriction endonuclease McrA